MQATGCDTGVVDELHGSENLSEKYVRPFYLKLMGFNAVAASDELLQEVHRRAGELRPAEVEGLLLSPWRQRVMGTWYAIAAPREGYRDVIHQSLRSSQGSLTAPALLVAVIQYSGSDGLAAIADYARADVASSWGSADAARAAAAILSGALGCANPLVASKPDELQRFRELIGVADRVRRLNL